MYAMNSVFGNAEHMYAYHLLEEFFDYFGLEGARSDIELLIEQSCQPHYFKKKKTAGNLVLIADALQKFIPACILLAGACKSEEIFLSRLKEDGLPDLDAKKDFMLYPQEADIWHQFPRDLAPGQYADPETVLADIKKYRSAEEWKQIIQELLEYALSKQSILAEYPELPILKLRSKLLSCLGAAYLLVVRYRRSQENTGDQQELQEDPELYHLTTLAV
jgi:hypothetical protein